VDIEADRREASETASGDPGTASEEADRRETSETASGDLGTASEEAATAASEPASGDPGAASGEADRGEASEEASGDPGAASGEADRRKASEMASGDPGAASGEADRGGTPEEASAEAVPTVLSAFIPQFYADRSLPDALLLPERHGDEELARWLEAEGVAVRVPGAGREAKLVELALKNARRRGGGADGTAALARRLGIDRPERVEGVDVSHAQGKAVVGSDVTFVGGSPEKRDYRRRKLTEENDDYANMRELVRWRAERAVEGRDDRPDPDLLLVDGGEGQLGAARDALAETGWDVPAVALAKAEELVVAPDGGPASEASGTSSRAKRSYGVHDWDDDDPALHLLQRVRDEAHRFAVQYHGTVRDEVSTPLDEVSGVGPELRKRLLRRFGSVDGVRSATREELAAVEGVGEATAEAIDQAL
jgi:excinuclease ABC subunit C